MMMISVVIGVFHIVLANVMNAYRYEHWPDRLPSIGWIGMICGGFTLAMSGSVSVAAVQELGIALMAIGALLIVWFNCAPRKTARPSFSRFDRTDPNFRRLRRCLELSPSVRAGAGIGIAGHRIQPYGSRRL